MLRVLLIVVLVHGLVPGVGELIETIVHRVATGHFAHAPGDVHDEDQGPEHGCGATAHRCGCCVSLPMLSSVRLELPGTMFSALGCVPALELAPPDGFVSALFRPPIG